MNFNIVKSAVAAQFEHMQKHQLFRVEIDKDKLWQTYLNSFPASTNPIFKTRTEHNCSCCKHFIRSVGDVVAIMDDAFVSVWDVVAPEYQPVMDAMAALVKASPIMDVFLHFEKTAGTDKNFQQLTEGVQTWTHFFVNINSRFVVKNDLIATKLNEQRSTRDAFLRSLTEITDESIETVLDLISQNSLYRGEEHKSLVASFKEVKREYANLSANARILASWTQTGALARIRNTVIGTLLQDLSEGNKSIDDAVRAYESKVAPMNYKRPTALITKAMIEKAKATISELGLTSALERRYAMLHDITINNLIFANRATQSAMTGSVLDNLSPTVGVKISATVEEVPIEKFLTEIVPRAESIEIMFESRLTGNLVSLIAPVDATSIPLFKWPNKFSWSYNGDVADSIKERVKKAGGNVNADLCCRLAWFNYDDLDLHLAAPDGHICFRNKIVGGGRLDVDMNAGGGTTREAVENIFYQDRSKMRKGVYTLYVNQYRRRETIDVGFEIEIDYLGEVWRFAYDKSINDRDNVIVAKFKYSHKDGFAILESLPSSQTVKTVWNLPSQSFHSVSALMLSPNYWDGNGIGNKHYFFMLDKCKNDGSARGFFNEFLRPELDVHRKVLEVVGSKMKTEMGNEQLSGLGFSSTQKNTLICRVKGSFSRTIKVQI